MLNNLIKAFNRHPRIVKCRAKRIENKIDDLREYKKNLCGQIQKANRQIDALMVEDLRKAGL